jgi:type II secretory pathway pseudopilin PulG
MKLRSNRGFSLLELLITVALGFTMAAVAVMAIMPLFNQNHTALAYDTALSTLRNYRTLSITQSKRYVLYFTPPGTITVAYWGVAVPVSPAPVTVATFTLPQDVQFGVQASFPNPGPDSFGTGNVAVTVNNCPIVTQNCVVFYPDGSAQDDQGNYNSGVIYLTRTGDTYSSRAITLFGTTGRIRGWRLYNQGGVNKWVQQ